MSRSSLTMSSSLNPGKSNFSISWILRSAVFHALRRQSAPACGTSMYDRGKEVLCPCVGIHSCPPPGLSLLRNIPTFITKPSRSYQSYKVWLDRAFILQMLFPPAFVTLSLQPRVGVRLKYESFHAIFFPENLHSIRQVIFNTNSDSELGQWTPFHKKLFPLRTDINRASLRNQALRNVNAFRS